MLLVIFGRDRLTWHEVDPEWANRDNLDQHLLGGFSRHDATTYLGKCGIDPGLLLEAILRITHDEAVPDREATIPSAWACAPIRCCLSGTGASSPTPARLTWRPAITASSRRAS